MKAKRLTPPGNYEDRRAECLQSVEGM